MTLEKDELGKFMAAIYAAGLRNGVDVEKMATILAEAVKEREDALEKEKKGNTAVAEEKVVIAKAVQPLYGPPPIKETVVVERVDKVIQPLYGPPPVKERVVVVETVQPLYGPPSVNDGETRGRGGQR